MYVPTDTDVQIATEGAIHSIKFHPEYQAEVQKLTQFMFTNPRVQKQVMSALRVIGSTEVADYETQETITLAAMNALVLYGYVLRDEIEDMYAQVDSEGQMIQATVDADSPTTMLD